MKYFTPFAAAAVEAEYTAVTDVWDVKTIHFLLGVTGLLAAVFFLGFALLCKMRYRYRRLKQPPDTGIHLK